VLYNNYANSLMATEGGGSRQALWARVLSYFRSLHRQVVSAGVAVFHILLIYSFSVIFVVNCSFFCLQNWSNRNVQRSTKPTWSWPALGWV